MTMTPLAPRTRPRRFGRRLLIALWFMLLLTPCACFYLSVQQEITIPLGGAPGQGLRVWLVMEPRARGLGYSLGQVASETTTSLCVQTSNRYLLWAGQGEDAVYCECYTRQDSTQPWSYAGSTQTACATSP